MTCARATTRGLSLDLNSPFGPQVSDLRSPEDINLNLYNFDKVDALNCPYVLTSPRSLEACANLGIKPVELLSKSFEEFRDELPSYTPFEEVKHLYKLFEIQRTKKLERCRKEREYIIQMERLKRHRSQSVSPGRRRNRIDMPVLEVVLSGSSDEDKNSSASHTEAQTPETPPQISTPGGDSHTTAESLDNDNLSVEDEVISRPTGSLPRSKSTPASPFHNAQGLQMGLLAITSSKVITRLEDNPRCRVKLPPKDIRLLEIMVKRREAELEAEEKRRRAHEQWECEREELRRRREEAAKTRSLKRSKEKNRECVNNQKRMYKSQPTTPDWIASVCTSSRTSHENLSHIERMKKSTPRPGELSERIAKMHLQLQQGCERDGISVRSTTDERLRAAGERVRNRVKELEAKIREKDERAQERVKVRRCEREREMQRSSEQLHGRINVARKNQKELDAALDMWRSKVSEYQVASNARAQERVKELLEEKKRKAQKDRETREKSFRKGLEKVAVLEGERLSQMIQRLRQKEQRARQFTTEKQAFISQSRALAKASSDLREQLKLKADLVEGGHPERVSRRRRGSSSTRSVTSTADSTTTTTATGSRITQTSMVASSRAATSKESR
ncbi:coiled-coil domain-containing protein 177 [Galendromus occidentalis]|uniref:Coiled-coil domain-containing protein 177 n=1 Tax=Galendromus occidentalis TaxID=34638 RepID=A0AAJ6VYT1_9ACAR|nr:coiled-coil domain-containing protein 177 [Galendromus occidentalis]